MGAAPFHVGAAPITISVLKHMLVFFIMRNEFEDQFQPFKDRYEIIKDYFSYSPEMTEYLERLREKYGPTFTGFPPSGDSGLKWNNGSSIMTFGNIGGPETPYAYWVPLSIYHPDNANPFVITITSVSPQTVVRNVYIGVWNSPTAATSDAKLGSIDPPVTPVGSVNGWYLGCGTGVGGILDDVLQVPDGGGVPNALADASYVIGFGIGEPVTLSFDAVSRVCTIASQTDTSIITGSQGLTIPVGFDYTHFIVMVANGDQLTLELTTN